ncbi:peptidoglycan-binding protein [Clostridiales bacterium PH28_bin88]|nr:peptidoglycan-binding protein [Clostridiales bacterium PH28_bin88]
MSQFCPQGVIRFIEPGDTLYSISLRYGVPVERILAANPGIDPLNLMIGQAICIPLEAVPACPGFMYTIRRGDTIYQLALRFHTTVNAILSVNPGINPRNLQIGQSICIPGTGLCPKELTPYTIKAGDTLFRIARRFNIRVEDIINANPGINPRNLQIGQQICLPL